VSGRQGPGGCRLQGSIGREGEGRHPNATGENADAAPCFASGKAAYVTGQTRVIDGGRVVRASLMALEKCRRNLIKIHNDNALED
jgi:hypothetical protein